MERSWKLAIEAGCPPTTAKRMISYHATALKGFDGFLGYHPRRLWHVVTGFWKSGFDERLDCRREISIGALPWLSTIFGRWY